MSFRLVMWAMGVLLSVASRLSARVRSQLGRDLVMVVESCDGAARSFLIEDRRVSSRPGAARGARCTLRFRSAAIGTRILLAPNAIDRILAGLASGDVECDGQAAYVLWFYQLVIGLVPFRRTPRDAWPDAYVAPNPNLKASDRITREPAVDTLAAGWTAAHRQRGKTMLWEVGRGAEPSGRFTRHRIVLQPKPDSSEHSP